jgi:transcriptional regulator of heat shock response
MDDRAFKILLASVREFINTGEPVSSKELYNGYDFGIKPASIRAELLRLEDSGFLEQPHTSGGRVPTEAGYEFFVNQLMSEMFGKTLGGLVALRDSLIEELMRRQTADLVDELSEELGTLTVGYEPNKNSLYKSGFENLARHLDVSQRDEFVEIISDFDRLNERIDKFSRSLKNTGAPQVYIGRKSPITASPHLSVIADSYEIDGEPLLLIAVGPKRMDYKKKLKVFKAIREKIK